MNRSRSSALASHRTVGSGCRISPHLWIHLRPYAFAVPGGDGGLSRMSVCGRSSTASMVVLLLWVMPLRSLHPSSATPQRRTVYAKALALRLLQRRTQPSLPSSRSSTYVHPFRNGRPCARLASWDDRH